MAGLPSSFALLWSMSSARRTRLPPYPSALRTISRDAEAHHEAVQQASQKRSGRDQSHRYVRRHALESCHLALNHGKVEVSAGVNLPMLIKLARVRDGSPLKEAVALAQEAGLK